MVFPDMMENYPL